MNRQGNSRRGQRGWLARIGVAAIMAMLLVGYAAPADAAVGRPFLSGVTVPSGGVWMGTHYWTGEHLLAGFCRVDQQPAGGFAVNATTCSRVAVAQGQTAFDPVGGFVYIPDLSSKSRGVWRLTFNRATETVGSPLLLVPTANLGPARPSSVALGPNGKLYVGFLRNDTIREITNPGGAPGTQTIRIMGRTKLGDGVSSMAFIGRHLYIGQGGTVGQIPFATDVPVGVQRIARGTPVRAAFPVAMTSDRVDTLYVASMPSELTGVTTIIRYTVSTKTRELLARRGMTPPTGSSRLVLVSSLALDPFGTLYIGDDPNELVPGSGHVFRIPNAKTAPPIP